jgi:GTPase
MVSECTRHPLRSLLILVLIQVPVIAIFTKMDSLDDEARNQLMWDDVPLAKIQKEVPIRAEAIFNKNYLERLEKVKHRPRHVVQLRGMLPFVHDTAT